MIGFEMEIQNENMGREGVAQSFWLDV